MITICVNELYANALFVVHHLQRRNIMNKLLIALMVVSGVAFSQVSFAADAMKPAPAATAVAKPAPAVVKKPVVKHHTKVKHVAKKPVVKVK